MKLILALIFLTTDILHGAEVKSHPCGDDSWTPYKDEKCVKLFETFLNRRQAQEFCNEQASISDTSVPSLVTIRSATEQLFLNEYVFNSSMDIPVWIGADRRPNNETEFDWIDSSPVERFTNWAVGYPTNNVARPCVQMRSQYSRQLSDMEWIDISCNGASWFICQKLQSWPIEQFQVAILSTRREVQHLVEDLTNLLVDMRNEIKEMRNEVTNLRNELTSETTNTRSEMTTLRNELTSETTNRRDDITGVRSDLTTTKNTLTTQMNTLQTNPVPAGFIYIQLSDQPEPRTIWGTVTWTEVTSQYAGLFFRAVGGGSAAFGSVQEEFCPRIITVERQSTGGQTATTISTANIGISAPISTGAQSTASHWALRFTVSAGEVRPRNSAVRIWRRN